MIDRRSEVIEALPEIDAHRKRELGSFQKSAGLRFRNINVLNLSFVHRSASNENKTKTNNERLEFLGDSVLGLVTATLLFQRIDYTEGEMAKIKSVVVSEETLSGIALELQLDTLLILGKGEDQSGGRTKKAILADALEALIGAYYLDSGYKAVFDFVSRFMNREIDRVLSDRYQGDYKTLLQELSQRLFHAYPSYRLIKKTGPDHERIFWMEVAVNGVTYGPGTGKNKKDAEREAAKLAYEALSPAKATRAP